MSPSSSALESIPSSTSTGAVEIKWVFRVNLWATSFKGIFLEKYPQFSKKNFLSEICRRSQFFVWVGTGRRNLKVATCLNNFLAGISTSAHCTGSYIFFSKIVQKKRQIKKICKTFQFPPAHVSLELVLTGAKNCIFFHINCYYHVHCKGPKCCRHWLEDLKGWKWIKIQIQKKFFLSFIM